ncbi:hypothetical protein [Streptomyces rubiginosohelvolus]|uniref:hypothetical protein n=1 Tax=Streptomyces rubiginosohelvolus TaxID=67362 RepID=UPI0035E2AB45
MRGEEGGHVRAEHVLPYGVDEGGRRVAHRPEQEEHQIRRGGGRYGEQGVERGSGGRPVHAAVLLPLLGDHLRQGGQDPGPQRTARTGLALVRLGGAHQQVPGLSP